MQLIREEPLVGVDGEMRLLSIELIKNWNTNASKDESRKEMRVEYFKLSGGANSLV